MKNDKSFQSRNDIFSSLRWIFFVSRRFSKVDSKGRSRVTSFLATLGISFGVMALITIISVMNGFQLSFIDAIMEISSYHIQIKDLPSEKVLQLEDFCKKQKNVRAVFPFYEAQALITSGETHQNASIIRALDKNILENDPAMKKELKIVSGSFDLSECENIVIGGYLARLLHVRTGDKVNLAALSGGKDVDLISKDRIFTVTGIFESGYTDINLAYSFVSLEAAEKYFGEDAPRLYGIKLKNYNDDSYIMKELSEFFPESKVQSWREYNRSFFGALRIEKNILMFLVFLIFVVVAINIYNGMRRLVFERSSEISIMSALGARNQEIRFIFVMRGFITGLIGTFSGVLIALFLCANMPRVFMFASDVVYYSEYFFTALFTPENLAYVRENPMYQLYASIPARVLFPEVVLISFFGIFSPLLSTALASYNVLKMKVAEVLHDE